MTEIRNCAGSTISLGVWSAKGQRIREVYIAVPKDAASLGLGLQWMALGVAEDVWHILEVSPNSPAENAGLLPYGDYVIASPDTIMHGESGLGQWVEEVSFSVSSIYANSILDVANTIMTEPRSNHHITSIQPRIRCNTPSRNYSITQLGRSRISRLHFRLRCPPQNTSFIR